MVSDVDRWIETARQCKYLPEHEMKVSGFTTAISVLFTLRLVNTIAPTSPANFILNKFILISFHRNCVTWSVIYCLKNPTYIMFQHQLQFVETFMAR